MMTRTPATNAGMCEIAVAIHSESNVIASASAAANSASA
jgi:hypothetical protein